MMWRRVLALCAIFVLVGGAGLFILTQVLDRIDSRATAQQAQRLAERADLAAHRADNAAALAVLNSQRVEKAALAACHRTRDVVDASNRTGAILYLVLSRRAAMPGGGISVGERKRYRALATLPLFQSRADCERAAADPEYKAPPPRPFATLPHWKVRQALRQGR